MPEPLYLGLDVGTTVLKAAVFAPGAERPVAAAGQRLRVATGAGGRREMNPHDLDRALGSALGRLRRLLRERWRRIAGVGLAAQGGSALLADRETGAPQTSLQLWNDTRPLDRLASIRRRRRPDYWRRTSRLDDPGAGLARLEWLREHHPHLFRDGSIYVGAGEYLYHRLTGLWRQDAGNALQIGCYSVRDRRLTAGPLQAVGVPLSFVAPLRQGHETHGLSADGARRLRLEAGVPVAGPYMDHEAGFLAAADAGPAPLQASLGTAWVANFITPAGDAGRPGFELHLPSPVDAGTLVVRVMFAGSLTWDWALRTFAGGTGAAGRRRAEGLLAERLLPPPGLAGLPWVTRPHPLAAAGSGAGGFLGVDGQTAPADLLRAAALGLVCEYRRLLERVLDAGRVRSLVLLGGLSAVPGVRALLAGLVAPLPVRRIADDGEAGARGVLHAFDPALAGAPTEPVDPPDRATCEALAERYALHRQTCRALAAGIPAEARRRLFGTAQTKGI